MEKKSMKMALRRDVIKKIENKAKTQLSFSKQRQGLFKEADAVVKMCEAELAIIIISNAGNVYSFGHPNADSVFQRYKAHKSSFDQRDEGNDDNKKHNLPENEEIDDRSGKEESQKGMILTAGSEMNNQEIDKKMA
ncbi:hypothetical protein ACH5RR_015778 [Cinchona calisaya]|uniref:MADS-box domain-containing protein n=1 Tax=Cinchona calisaya TaxID=153742 RepID=A0ABD2ZU52_9GENT